MNKIRDNMFIPSKTDNHDKSIQFAIEDEYFNIYKRELSPPIPNKYYPHTHPYHEIFILLDGQLDYLVEGVIFPLSPGDVVLISAGDPHSKFLKNDFDFTILVIELSRNFFSAYGCSPYEKIFTSQNSYDHKINADSAKESGLAGAYKRLISYSNDETNMRDAVIKSTLIEILYLLNNTEFSKNYIASSPVQQIVAYINTNYKKKVSLDDIAEELFLSKHYICKTFKKYTGDTIKGYITKKRLAKVEQLTNNGYNISSACLHSGFSDYSSFYKAFLKTHGKPPKELLK